jgi:flavin-dependent dehydrogenase
VKLVPIRLWSAQSQHLNRVCGPGWVAAGDAASTFDPLSSAGILKALRWGKIASFAAIDHFTGNAYCERYESLLQAEYRSYLATRQHFYQMEQRWPQSKFWRRRAQPASALADHAENVQETGI